MKKNVIVLMLDSLQFNYLGCYGNTWIKTPNMDRLAREGVLFENNYIEGLPTVPARRTMLCGRYFLPTKGWSALGLEDTTIADMCWAQPIDTGLVFDTAPMRLPKFGYARGFDKVYYIHGQEGDHDFYRDDPLVHLNPMDYLEENVIDSADKVLGGNMVAPQFDEIASFLKYRQYWKCEEDQNVPRVMKKAVQYLEEVDRNKQFFLWVDSFDPHEPWDPPSVYDPDMKCPYDPDYRGKDMILPIYGEVDGLYTEGQLHHIRMLYAEKVTMVDRWVGYLMDKVKALGLEGNTLFLLISDHGEPMGSGEHGHGIMRKCRPWPYEELAHAPMIMKGPGLPAGKRVKGFTQSCDVAPTVTEWLGLGVHPMHQGKSLLPLAKGEVDKVRDFAICGYHRYSASIITEDWSFIHWTKPDERSTIEAVNQIYASGTAETSGHLAGLVKGDNMSTRWVKYQSTTTLDNEEQWTCTPGSLAEVPTNDMLYDRRADPFQQINIADKDPKTARELYNTVREFMAELRTT